MNDKLTGLVIRQTDYQDNDAILLLYTREYGGVSFYARGLRKITSRNAYACQLFDYSEFLTDYNPAKEVQLLKSASLKKEYAGIKGDYDRLALASVMIEIAWQLEGENIYDLLQPGLDLMDQTTEPYTVFGLFVGRLLDRLGIAPEVDECVICGDPDNIAAISLADGGFVCRNCNRTIGLKPLPVETLRKFRIINKADYSVYDRILGLGLNDFSLARLQAEFLMMHSGLELKSWRSVAGGR
jgi:DNA repair protein RecO (recombination protein O)